MARIGWLIGCTVLSWMVLGWMPLDALAQLGSEGGVAVADDASGAQTTDSAKVPGRALSDTDDSDFCRCAGVASGETVDRIQRELDGQLNSEGMEFSGVALSQVVAALQDDYQIPIQLDVPALDNAGIGPDEPVSIKLQNISLRSALRLLLKQLQLTYVIENEVLTITTPEEAESRLLTCVYDVRDLIDDAGAKHGVDSLRDAIVSCVATETWAENGGGEADIHMLPQRLFVISQTQAVHEEIRALLRAIRETIADDRHSSTPSTANSNAIVTRHYTVYFGEGDGATDFQKRIVELINRLTPNAAWDAPLADGQAPILTALPDRLVVRHTLSVQDEVQAAPQDLGLTSPSQGAAADRVGGGFGGGAGGGGGMFRRPAKSN